MHTYKISGVYDYIIISTQYIDRLPNYNIPNEIEHPITLIADEYISGIKLDNTLKKIEPQLKQCVIIHSDPNKINLNIGMLNFYTNILGTIGYCAFCNSENIYLLQHYNIDNKRILYAMVDTESG